MSPNSKKNKNAQKKEAKNKKKGEVININDEIFNDENSLRTSNRSLPETERNPQQNINSELHDDDDQDPLKYRKLFVGGIPFNTSDEELRQFFSSFGNITEAAIIRDRRSGISKGYGFVTMATKEDAARAIANPNPYIGNRRCNVNYSFIGAKKRDVHRDNRTYNQHYCPPQYGNYVYNWHIPTPGPYQQFEYPVPLIPDESGFLQQAPPVNENQEGNQENHLPQENRPIPQPSEQVIPPGFVNFPISGFPCGTIYDPFWNYAFYTGQPIHVTYTPIGMNPKAYYYRPSDDYNPTGSMKKSSDENISTNGTTEVKRTCSSSGIVPPEASEPRSKDLASNVNSLSGSLEKSSFSEI